MELMMFVGGVLLLLLSTTLTVVGVYLFVLLTFTGAATGYRARMKVDNFFVYLMVVSFLLFASGIALIRASGSQGKQKDNNPHPISQSLPDK